MFTRSAAHIPRPSVSIEFEGRTLAVESGQSVAAALASSGIVVTRETPSGRPRGAYCMMGVCFECLVVIDGIPARQGCLVRVKDGMRVARNAPAMVSA